MLICPKCGYENDDGTPYCDDCGADLSEIEPQPQAGEEVIQPEEQESEPAAEPAVTPAEETGMVEEEPEEKEPVQPEVQGGKAQLTVLRGENPGEEFPIVFEGLHVIGRKDPEGKPVDIDLTDQGASLPEPTVSRQHAAIKFENGKYTVEDLDSTNGTSINREPFLQVGQPQELNDGDTIILGRVHLKFTLT